MVNDNLSDYVKQINDTFGPANKCFGKEFRLNFPANNLESFLNSLEEKNFILFNRSVMFFRLHMESLYYLINKDINEASDAIESLYPHVWSKLAFSIIFSIIDGITKTPYVSISAFLIDKFDSIKTKEDIKNLCEKYYEKYGSVNRLSNFYNAYLDETEKRRVIKNYMPEDKKRINTIQGVIKDMYGRVRSGFLHDMGMKVPYHEEITFSSEEKSDTITIFNNLSPSRFLFLSWKAIFKFFGYKNEINANFTEEEMKSGKTIKGTQISFPLA